MGTNMMVYGSTRRSMVKAYSLGELEKFTTATTRKTNDMAKEK